MEFFERAHVAKGNSSQKKGKSDENMKKQLKQMLYGYRQSNIELIKNSENMKNDTDDSTSVSGFSDLNLTNSSNDGDMPHEALSLNPDDVSSFDINEVSLNKSPNNFDIDEDNQNDSVSVTIESISDCTDDIHSLSENIVSETHEYSTSEDDTSLNSSLLQTLSDNETDDSETFDADGALAGKILKRLGKTEKAAKHSKIKKIKSNVAIKETLNSDDDFKYKGRFKPKDDSELDVIMEDSKNYGNFGTLSKSKEFRGPKGLEDAAFEITESEDNLSIVDSDQSSPFVSVMATDMLSQSLDDILGDYKHSTMKNLPSDSHNYNAIFSTNNTDLGLAEDLNVNDSQIDEDMDSLIPEIDDDVAVDDIDLETTLDTSKPLHEYTVYNETLQSERMSEREPSAESIDTTLCNPVKVYYGRNNCVFLLRHPAEIFIHGKVKVKALGGTVEVLGYILQDNKPYEIYAPNYNFAQYLRTVGNENAYYGLFGKLTAAGLTVSEAEEIVNTLGEHDGVISFQPLRSQKFDFVENNFTVTDLFTKTSKHVDNCFKKAAELLGCSLYLSKPWKQFQENTSWKKAISCNFENQSRGIICGGKGSGKSTFLRYYVNKLLAQGPILVIDMDPGQCEFTPAGNVSATIVTEPLLGPNFTHLQTPEIMLNIGIINTMDNPRRYANAIESLITHCYNDSRFANMPWIVNTMGMTNAMGLKFMSLIILQIKPTFLLQIDSKNPKKRFESHLYPYIIKQEYFERYHRDLLFRNVGDVENLEYVFFISHHMENSGKNNFSLAPRDERYLNLLAYFGELLSSHRSDLLGIVPYQINLRDLNVGTNVKISGDALKRVINGKVVALCQHTADSGLFTLGDKPLRCRGLGLIRGTDWEKGILYIITPTSVPELETVNTLVYADWVPELRAQEGQLPPGTAIPYRTASRYQQRELMFAPRRRFNPLQLLKMSRNS